MVSQLYSVYLKVQPDSILTRHVPSSILMRISSAVYMSILYHLIGAFFGGGGDGGGACSLIF